MHGNRTTVWENIEFDEWGYKDAKFGGLEKDHGIFRKWIIPFFKFYREIKVC